MSAFAIVIPALGQRWLRDARFDLIFILGVLALAAGTGAFVVAFPHLFLPILIVWFFSLIWCGARLDRAS